MKDFLTFVKEYLKTHKNGHECSRDAFRTELRAYRPSAAWRVKNFKEIVIFITLHYIPPDGIYFRLAFIDFGMYAEPIFYDG